MSVGTGTLRRAACGSHHRRKLDYVGIHQGNELHETWVVEIGPRAARHLQALRAGAIPNSERHVSGRDTEGASSRRARRPARAVPVGGVVSVIIPGAPIARRLQPSAPPLRSLQGAARPSHTLRGRANLPPGMADSPGRARRADSKSEGVAAGRLHLTSAGRLFVQKGPDDA